MPVSIEDKMRMSFHANVATFHLNLIVPDHLPPKLTKKYSDLMREMLDFTTDLNKWAREGKL